MPGWYSPEPENTRDGDVPDMTFEDFFHVLAVKKLWPVGKFYVHVWW